MLINVREHRRGIKNGQSRDTDNIVDTRRRKKNKAKKQNKTKPTQCVLDTTIPKQTQIT